MRVEDEIVLALRRVIRAVDLHSRRLVQTVGLTWPQLATMRAVRAADGCSMSALAKQLRLGNATLTGIVQRLERNGYVSRRRNEADGRSVVITVTESGQSILGRAPSLLQDRFLDELAKLKDWELHQTLSTLQRIAEMMDAETLVASPMLVSGPVDATPAEVVEVAPGPSCPPPPKRIRRRFPTRPRNDAGTVRET